MYIRNENNSSIISPSRIYIGKVMYIRNENNISQRPRTIYYTAMPNITVPIDHGNHGVGSADLFLSKYLEDYGNMCIFAIVTTDKRPHGTTTKGKKRNGYIYHIMLRGINRQDIFEEEEDYLQMTSILRRLVERYDEKIYIETSSDALSIHEIAHVRQSLVAGGMRFKDGNLVNVGSNYPNGEEKYNAISNMEIEAYKMQYSYDKSFPGTVNSLKDIGVHSVGGIMNGGAHVYDAIYQYSFFLKERNKIKRQ